MCLKIQQIRSDEYERVGTLEMEGQSLRVEVKNLPSVIERQTVQVETQKEAQAELKQKATLSDEKHKKETGACV